MLRIRPNVSKEKKDSAIKRLGQVFTPLHIIRYMLSLKQSNNSARVLEPSCGNGAFCRYLGKNSIGIEIDSRVITNQATLHMDFFAYPISEKFHTIIGNPPYVRYRDIVESTKTLLSQYMDIFDLRSNLYLFFIYKSILHLHNDGELIFITPRDFLKSTSSVRLNEFLYSQGSITHIMDLGDKKIFSNVFPNCIIWRFEKDNFSRSAYCLHDHCTRHFSCINGQISFSKKIYSMHFSDIFFVKVGAVSGADSIFTNELGNMDFVYSQTATNGKTRKMFYGEDSKNSPFIQAHKQILLQRKIKVFSESNWWTWGRGYYKSNLARIYVNVKTRNKKPFFIHECLAYDGSILAIFPKFRVDIATLHILCERLNALDWQDLGFMCDGRLIFSQRSLESCLLDSAILDGVDIRNNAS